MSFSLLLLFDLRGVFDGFSEILHGNWPKSNQCLLTRNYCSVYSTSRLTVVANSHQVADTIRLLIQRAHLFMFIVYVVVSRSCRKGSRQKRRGVVLQSSSQRPLDIRKGATQSSSGACSALATLDAAYTLVIRCDELEWCGDHQP